MIIAQKTLDVLQSNALMTYFERFVRILKGNLDKQVLIHIREVVQLSKLKIISNVRINGQLMLQEEVEPEMFRKLMEEKIDFAMSNQGFKKDKTA